MLMYCDLGPKEFKIEKQTNLGLLLPKDDFVGAFECMGRQSF